jgi:hypothetical protein
MFGILTFTHRWVGVVLALFMLTWISSGLLIAFAQGPSMTHSQQLARAADLAPQVGWLSLGEALAASESARAQAGSRTQRAAGMGAHEHAGERRVKSDIVDARLARVDGVPVWLVEDDRGRRSAISAIDGAPIEITLERAERIARAWLDPGAAPAISVAYLDTVDAPIGLRNAEALKPFYRFAVADDSGTQVVVSQRTGEVAQSSTRAERAVAYAGSWLHLFHWLDAFDAGEYRRAALSWIGFFAAVAALSGLILGWIRWRPGLFGRPTYTGGRTQPFREFWLKYHFWVGLIGGVFGFFWTASGFLATNPAQIFSPATAGPDELARFRGGPLPAVVTDWKPGAALPVGPEVAELQWTRLGAEARLFAYTRDGARRPLDLEERAGGGPYSDAALISAAQRLAGGTEIAAHELLSAYDSYYYPNRRQTAEDKPLPVLRVDLEDAGRTSLYIDPAQGRLVAKFDESRRAYRWLYSAIHHWDFGWLQNRWLWNGWMATWIGFVFVLSLSAVVLGWRRLRRTFQPAAAQPQAARAPGPAKPAAQASS